MNYSHKLEYQKYMTDPLFFRELALYFQNRDHQKLFGVLYFNLKDSDNSFLYKWGLDTVVEENI